MTDIELINGDCFDELDDIEENSIDAIITDSPYGLAFMGESWDDFSPQEYQEWCKNWGQECLRVLKDGGHMLAFSGSRTHHRLFSGLENAGFRIRDTITWHYGSGFPKGQDLSSLIDRYYDGEDKEELIKEWEGWRSQLKPATEFIVLARKPLSENAIYKNVLKHGTGALNIDACRVPTEEPKFKNKVQYGGKEANEIYKTGKRSDDVDYDEPPDGRYPSNLLLSNGGQTVLDNWTDSDEETEARKQSEVNSSESDITHKENTGSMWNKQDYEGGMRQYGDGGGKSRYFPKFDEPKFKYTSKASKSERTHDGEVDNDHPTVKPVDLMEWLVKMVTKENQTVLDPFAGSGTTGIACKKNNRNFIGIEREDEYYKIAKNRIDELDD